jgi:hypothetical protein
MSTSSVPEVGRRDPEALAIYLVLATVGALRLIVALAIGETFGAEDTIAIAMVTAGVSGLLARR